MAAFIVPVQPPGFAGRGRFPGGDGPRASRVRAGWSYPRNPPLGQSAGPGPRSATRPMQSSWRRPGCRGRPGQLPERTAVRVQDRPKYDGRHGVEPLPQLPLRPPSYPRDDGMVDRHLAVAEIATGHHAVDPVEEDGPLVVDQ